MRDLPLEAAALGAFAAVFMLAWPLRPRAELIVESARPGEVVEMRGRWTVDGDTMAVRRLVTPFRMRVPRGVFVGEFVAADPRATLRLRLIRPGVSPDTLFDSTGGSVGAGTVEKAFSWSLHSVGGGGCGAEGRINPAYVPLGAGTPLCLFAGMPKKCTRARSAGVR